MTCTVAGTSAIAQVAPGELVIEGPIESIDDNSITVMGITISVPDGKANTATKSGVPLASLNDPLPGREHGFVGGTAIVTGGSQSGAVTATEVFSDLSENVIVGEVTSEKGQDLEVNGMPVYPIPRDTVMPAKPAMNIFGFEIDPNSVDKGSLISIEGYYTREQGPRRLYYHDLEADTGNPIVWKDEISVTRAQCRKRSGTGKDELQVQGAVHLKSLQEGGPIPNIPPTLAAPTISWSQTANGVYSTPVTAPRYTIDPLVPQYGEYRYRATNLRLTGCPLWVKVQWRGDTDIEHATVTPE